jgi:DNA replication licensing factor MCM6
MDVAARSQPRQAVIKDVLGERVQKMFQDFLEEFQEDEGELKYLLPVKELMRPERNTLLVSFRDVEEYSTKLANIVQEQYYHVFPFLCLSVRNFARDRGEVTVQKEFYVAFEEVPARHK